MKKKNVFIGVAVFIVLIGIVLYMTVGQAAEANLFTLKKGGIQSYLELRGKVELDKKRKVYSKIAGTIDKIDVNEGNSVNENTQLLSLELKDADLSLQKSQAAFDAAKASADGVKKSIKPEQVYEAASQVAQAKAQFEAAQKDNAYKQDFLNKVKVLYESNAVSKQDLKEAQLQADSSESNMKNMNAAVISSENNLELLKKGATKEEVDAAEASARQTGLQVEDSQNNLDRTKVYADMKGTVLSKFVAEGDFIQSGSQLFEIGDMNTAYITVSVLSDDAVKIKEGQKAIITGDALKDKQIEGEVYYVAPKALDSVSTLGVEQQRVEVRIRFDNIGGSLKPGYGVDVNLITDENKSTVFVPYKAVFQMNGNDSVLMDKDNKVVLKAVKKGIENKDYIEIKEGLTEGDIVVVDPDGSLKPGMRVKKQP